MQLTEDERAALERWRECQSEDEAAATVDALRLMGLLMRLFPVRTYGDLVIRWDDEITPERLVACGFNITRNIPWIVNQTHQLTLYQSGIWEATHLPFCIHEKVYPTPRNMLDVWQLMERCGSEEGGK